MIEVAPLGARAEADLREQAGVLARALDRNTDGLAAARALVDGATAVRLLGIGSSRHAAGIGAAWLETVGVVTSLLPAPGVAVALPPPRRDLPVLVLSQSGETPALLAAVADARRLGAPVIAISNASGSALASLADVALDCAAGEERVVAATKSVTAQVLLLRALAGPPPDVAALVAAVGDLVDGDLARFVVGDPPQHVVAGGLGAEWVAQEVALKFAEMCGRLLSAEPLVEHLHGPAAVPAAVLALVDARDPNAGALRPPVVRVGPGGADVGTAALADPAAAAVLALVAGQCAALGWARRLGEDADQPRGLHKVTDSR